MSQPSACDAPPPGTPRRQFVKTAAAGGAAAAIAFPTVTLGAPNDKKLKIGVVGCGGRGGGAMVNALKADDNVELWALGDLYEEEAATKLEMVRRNSEIGERVAADADRRIFSGLDNFEQVMDSGIDVVLLTSPPAFRPQHFKAAVERGIHAFVEKPCATDVQGVHEFLRDAKVAADKDLSVLSGFCYRYSEHGQPLFERIHDGAIGDILSVHSTYYASPVKPMPEPETRPDGMGDTEWQIRNWYNFTWLAGDGIVEQGCHNVDRVSWAFQDAKPVAAHGTGGRARPNNEGNIYDHFSVTYEYPDDVFAHVEWRQFLNPSHQFVGDIYYGTKGVAKFGTSSAEITGENPWNWRRPRTPKSMYDLEHEVFFAAIRSGERLDDAEWLAHSTTLAILGREVCYTGRRLTWEDIEESDDRLVPEVIDLDADLPIRPIRIPGVMETQGPLGQVGAGQTSA